MIHSLAWVTWLIVTLITIANTRNPFYLLLALIILSIISQVLRAQPSEKRVNLPLLSFSVTIVLTASIFNALTSHYGAHELFTIPWNIPLISGAVTLEALAYGATNGLVLSGIFMAFNIFNQAVPVRALIRMIPKAFYPIALMVSIALTFIPSLIRRITEIRDAQAIRGHQMRGIRDWLPLFLPLLIDSQEKALQLAEAMTARGFAGEDPTRPFDRDRIGILLGVGLILGAVILQIMGGPEWIFTLMLAVSAVLFVLVFWSIGRRSTRTTYRKEEWTPAAWLIVIGAAVSLLVMIIPLPFTQRLTLTYSTYPSLMMPGFDPIIGISIIGLLIPAFLTGSKAND